MPGYLYSQGISVLPYLDDWLVHHPEGNSLLSNQSVFLFQTLELVDSKRNFLQVRTRSSPRHSVSQVLTSSGSESCSMRFQGSVGCSTCLHSILPHVVFQMSSFMGSLICPSGLTQLVRLHQRLLQSTCPGPVSRNPWNRVSILR